MNNQTKNLLSLDLASFAVYAVPSTPPVAILNESSSLHGRLQYCLRAVENLEMISSVGTTNEHIDVQNLAVVFGNLLEPLSKMLGRLVVDSEILESV